jgi:uncharacterized protein
MSESRPRPVPTRDGLAFWRGLAAHDFTLPFCPECQAFFYPPQPRCARCLTGDIQWRSCTGLGTLRSWAVVRHPFTPGIPLPYVVAEIELDVQPGLVIDSTLTSPQDQSLQLGMPVTVTFIDDPRGFTVHAFRPVQPGEPGRAQPRASAGSH